MLAYLRSPAFFAMAFLTVVLASFGWHILMVKIEPCGVFKEVTKLCTNEILGGGSLRSRFYYRVLGLAPAARPRREHFVFAGCTAGKLATNWLPPLKTGLNRY